VRSAWVAGAVVAIIASSCSGDSNGDKATFCTRYTALTTRDPFAALPDEATAADVRRAYKDLRARADGLGDAAVGEARPVAAEYAAAVHALDDLLAGALYDGNAVDQPTYRDRLARYQLLRDRLQQAAEAMC
jgi:hypothetical protein